MDNSNIKQASNVTENKVCDKNCVFPNSFVEKYCAVNKKCNIEEGVKILEFSSVKNTEIKKGTTITHSYIEESIIGQNCTIGPFARIRPKCKIEDNVKIGNFVEIKNSIIHSGVKISHLAYVGDAEIGENTNVGCGVIFANYNGKTKNKIVVGKGCFIGSNCNLIAPLNIADHTYICAGTTVTEDTNEYDFVIGRSRQTVKPNLAKKYLKEEND